MISQHKTKQCACFEADITPLGYSFESVAFIKHGFSGNHQVVQCGLVVRMQCHECCDPGGSIPLLGMTFFVLVTYDFLCFENMRKPTMNT